MLLHVDAATGRTTAADPALLARIGRIARAHTDLPRPDRAGRAIAMPDGRRPA
jgi:ATP-dependent 26S proteasome regulatory subunit